MTRKQLLAAAKQRAHEIIEENAALSDDEFRCLCKLSPDLATARLTLTIVRKSCKTALIEIETALIETALIEIELTRAEAKPKD